VIPCDRDGKKLVSSFVEPLFGVDGCIGMCETARPIMNQIPRESGITSRGDLGRKRHLLNALSSREPLGTILHVGDMHPNSTPHETLL